MATTHTPTPDLPPRHPSLDGLLDYLADRIGDDPAAAGEHTHPATTTTAGGASTPSHPDTGSTAYAAGAGAARAALEAGVDADHLVAEYNALAAAGDHNAAAGYGHVVADTWTHTA